MSAQRKRSTALSDVSTSSKNQLRTPLMPSSAGDSPAASPFTNFSLFQQQLANQQRQRQQAALQAAATKGGRKSAQAKEAAATTTSPRPPSTSAPSGRSGRSTNRQVGLHGVIAPTVISGEAKFAAPDGHNPSIAAQHLFQKACRQAAKRIEQSRLLDAALRLQRWFRLTVRERAALRRLQRGTAVHILVHKIGMKWLKRARASIQRKADEVEQAYRRVPFLAKAAWRLQTWWRCCAARRLRRHMLEVQAAVIQMATHETRIFFAARVIQTYWRMAIVRKRTFLARMSLKHFRVGRVVHQVRHYFFKRQRQKLRDAIAAREERSARLIQDCWRVYLATKQRRACEFYARKYLALSDPREWRPL